MFFSDLGLNIDLFTHFQFSKSKGKFGRIWKGDVSHYRYTFARIDKHTTKAD